jgi:hypothetical protein
MKKIFIILAGALAFTSCNKVVLSQEEYNALVNKPNTKQHKPFSLNDYGAMSEGSSEIILGSDQHEYLVIDKGRYSETVMHYVDCELCVLRKRQEFGQFSDTSKDSISEDDVKKDTIK